jgi:hypothetical protein
LTGFFKTPTTPDNVLSEFTRHGEEAGRLAADLLKALGSDLMPEPDPDRVPDVKEFTRWLAMLCRLAIADPSGVSYQLRHCIDTERRTDIPTAVASFLRWDDTGTESVLWEPFGSALHGEMTLPPGVYLLSPTGDVRAISIEAIRLLLEMERTKGSKPPADPIDLAARSLEGCSASVRLVRYLAGRPDRKAHLDDIAVELDHAPRVTARNRRKTIYQRFRRTRDLLKRVGGPVRLTIDRNVVSLVVIVPEPEDDTRK